MNTFFPFQFLRHLLLISMIVVPLQMSASAHEDSLLLHLSAAQWELKVYPSSKKLKGHGSSDINLYLEGYKLAPALKQMMQMVKAHQVEVQPADIPLRGNVRLKLTTNTFIPIREATEQAFMAVLNHFQLKMVEEYRPEKGWELRIADAGRLKQHRFQPERAQGVAQRVSIHDQAFSAEGLSLPDLCERLSIHWQKNVWTNASPLEQYNFELDLSPPKQTAVLLKKQYGIEMVPSNRKAVVWVVKP